MSNETVGKGTAENSKDVLAVGTSDGLACQGCWGEGPHDENCKLCITCDGTGKLRANFTNKKGQYTFHKESCYRCGGTGLAS